MPIYLSIINYLKYSHDKNLAVLVKIRIIYEMFRESICLRAI